MNKERALLKEQLRRALDSKERYSTWLLRNDIEIDRLTSQIQPKQEPLSEATINYYLERLGSHFKWDDGFEAGVKWAERQHGIIGGGE